jgi:preprotein translocase subunit SecD
MSAKFAENQHIGGFTHETSTKAGVFHRRPPHPAFNLYFRFRNKREKRDNTITYIKGIEDIRWGTDINGGVEVTFSPATSTKATKEQMDSAESIIKLRLVNNNITDYEVYTDYNHDRIIVRFPWKSDEENFDPQQAIDELSATALVTFREGMEYATETTDADGNPVYKTPTGVTASNIILQGSDIESAKAELTQDQSTGLTTYQIALKLSDSGAEKFAEATERLKGRSFPFGWMIP